MNSKVWPVVLLLAFVVVVESTGWDESQWAIARTSADGDLMRACEGRVGDCIGEGEERMLASESDRRQLAGRGRYVSYEALRRNNVPCNQRGQSYYSNCKGNVRANPYNRGCTVITRCARYLG